MYKKCIACPKLGDSCKGPDIKEMTAPEVLEWCKLRKAQLRLSNAKLADLSGTPKGTLDRVFAGEHPDFKFETIRPVINALIGGSFEPGICPAPPIDEQAEDTIASLREQLEELKQQHQQNTQETKEESSVRIDFLKAQLKREQRVVAILAIILAFALALIICALIVDKLNSDIGFFWLDDLAAFGRNTGSDIGSIFGL